MAALSSRGSDADGVRPGVTSLESAELREAKKRTYSLSGGPLGGGGVAFEERRIWSRLSVDEEL